MHSFEQVDFFLIGDLSCIPRSLFCEGYLCGRVLVQPVKRDRWGTSVAGVPSCRKCSFRLALWCFHLLVITSKDNLQRRGEKIITLANSSISVGMDFRKWFSSDSPPKKDPEAVSYIPAIKVENTDAGRSRDTQEGEAIPGPSQEGSRDAHDVWNDLPEGIRNDPSMQTFRQGYEQRESLLPTSKKRRYSSSDGEGSSGAALSSSSRSSSILDLVKAVAASAQSLKKPRSAYTTPCTLSPSPTHVKPSCSSSSAKRRKFHPIPPPSAFCNDDDDDDDDVSQSVMKGRIMRRVFRYARMTALFALWLLFTIILMTKSEKVKYTHQTSIPPARVINFWVLEPPATPDMSIILIGSLLPPAYANLSRYWLKAWIEQTDMPWVPPKGAVLLALASSSSFPSNTSTILDSDPDGAVAVAAVSYLHTTIDSNASIVRGSSDESSYQEVDDNGSENAKFKFSERISDIWSVPLVSEALVDFVPEVEQQNVFHLTDFEVGPPKGLLRLRLETNLQESFPVSIRYDPSPINVEDGIVYATLVLMGLYVLIIFDIVHRTLAALLASTMSIAILAALNERPTMPELISWIDIETLLLLFSMMTLVAVLSETGIFDYLAVYAYKITGGRIWPLINTLCLFTALLSAFLDNVTTTLLMTPVTIRLCEEMKMNPIPILLSMVIYSNIGGTATAVGDPPNVILASNRNVIDAGIDFTKFSLHMGTGVILVMITVNVLLRFMFRNIMDLKYNNEPQDVQELRHEIAICQRAAASLSSYSKDEEVLRDSLLEKVKRLLSELKLKNSTGSFAEEHYRANLEELQEKYPIRDWPLLIKSTVVLTFVISIFFVHSLPELQLSLGWTAFLGAMLLLILADQEDLEGVLARIEWGTLLFFAALFILMEALSRLGLIEWVGVQTEAIIHSVGPEHRLAVAILLILWVSAVASAFVDNIPLTTVMVRIITSLSANRELNLPLPPLVWALAFGACLGGNGTLIGSSANVVCAGVAEQHGYRFTFIQFFKVGFPITIASVIVVTMYLLVCHVALDWN
ncbi:P protein-like isoform X2 [Ischnura elegans]|uniref:P protein-like isoform X2 n=1 Tax=Ischnura elegans TaxID=197161 RepID=UPI001ED87864|nr:P protein-like isoform X2 [Ischnura elegans]